MTLARVRALVVVGSLAAIAATVVIWAILRDSQNQPDAAANARNCREGEVQASLEVPEPKDVTVNVYNDTDRTGLAASVANQLKSRGFKIGKVAQDQDREVVRGTAELRFGPKGVGAAHLLAAHVLEADMVPDTARTEATVDLVLGLEFKQLATPSEVNDALRLMGDPSPPAGMC